MFTKNQQVLMIEGCGHRHLAQIKTITADENVILKNYPQLLFDPFGREITDNIWDSCVIVPISEKIVEEQLSAERRKELASHLEAVVNFEKMPLPFLKKFLNLWNAYRDSLTK